MRERTGGLVQKQTMFLSVSHKISAESTILSALHYGDVVYSRTRHCGAVMR